MARKPRIFFPGAIYHVMLRGNNGEPIFFCDDTRSYFLQLLEEGVERFGYKVHAFCLMSNHVHLAIQVGTTDLAKIVQNLSFRYVRKINHSFDRIGHLFQGRYKAILIDGEEYLLTLIRYIHLNPVRANLTACPEEYPWSSHRAYLGFESHTWLTCDAVLSRFAEDRIRARTRYANFMQSSHDPEIIKFEAGSQKGHSILGDKMFFY